MARANTTPRATAGYTTTWGFDGIYADSDGLVVRNNIVRHNAGFGIHCYSDVKNAYIADNLVYGHTFRPGVLIACATHVGKNVIVNNTIVDNAIGIRISGGNGDKVYNNIVVAKTSTVSLTEDTVGTMVDYNLCVPDSPQQGPHCLSAEPGFIAPGAFCYWLREDSVARGKGAAEFAPKTDFWGRPPPPTKRLTSARSRILPTGPARVLHVQKRWSQDGLQRRIHGRFQKRYGAVQIGSSSWTSTIS